MDEAEARTRLDVPRGTIALLEGFETLLRSENESQNLVSAASLDQFWSRHVLDSAQLLRFAPQQGENWVDLGTGAGFPGLIVGLLHRSKVVLVESRRLRADFLRRAAALLGIEEKIEILCARAETLPSRPYGVISARAFAPLAKTFAIGARFSTPGTRWILPRGRSAKSELEAAQASWQGDFRLEPSVTDPEAWILVAEQVRPKPKGKK